MLLKLPPWVQLAIPVAIAACLAPYSNSFRKLPHESVQGLVIAGIVFGLLIPQTRRQVLLWVAVGVAAASTAQLFNIIAVPGANHQRFLIELSMRLIVGILAAFCAIRMAFLGETDITQIGYIMALGFYFIGHGWISIIDGRRDYPVLIIGVGVYALTISIWRLLHFKPVKPNTDKPKRKIHWQ